DRPVLGIEISPNLPDRGEVDLAINLAPLRNENRVTQGVAIVIDDVTETRRLQGQTQLFERMVSPAVIRQLNPNSIQLGGKRAEITTLFADVRGFTTFSEEVDP
ncbi:MAG: hypothetical protein GWO08_02685, partial [Gammaproteobacteria bacterium]|nr:hypothetical protein [candidate division Zixibacteria bacterium]NIR92597.1 hypothetical protein [Gammaproteobacteria bacterium]NIW48286.1 hypothetical protein [Gammaproteobacteria bacterium]